MHSTRREGIITTTPGYTFSHLKTIHNSAHEAYYINDHIESVDRVHHGTHSSWVPPNDRELIIRAKLKTGWSSRQNSPTTATTAKLHSDASSLSSNCSSQISDMECLEIEKVLTRAAKIEKKELTRIKNLYDRWNLINKPLGNGKTNCFICNCNFGILESSPKICSDCLMNVCGTCSIDTVSFEFGNSKIIYFCKICSEYREFLKKSGAWFSKKLPLEDPTLKRQIESVTSLGSVNLDRDPNNNDTSIHLKSNSDVELMQLSEKEDTDEEGLVRSVSGPA